MQSIVVHNAATLRALVAFVHGLVQRSKSNVAATEPIETVHEWMREIDIVVGLVLVAEGHAFLVWCGIPSVLREVETRRSVVWSLKVARVDETMRH